jgi:glycosyltransferase involved in cell wall biosynthesis
LLRERYPRQRVLVQPHGVPAEEYERDRRDAARRAFPQIDRRPMFLMAGRIDKVKNQHWVVEQFAEVARRHPEALLVVAGSVTDAPYAQLVERTIRELGLGKNVLLTGPLPSGDPRLVGLFQEARALILPSLSETFGLVILEAWASGAPVISSRTSGALGLIKERENGWLFDLNEQDGFHRAMHAALTAPETARRMGEAGKTLVKANYDTIALAGRVKGLYEELIRAKGKR